MIRSRPIFRQTLGAIAGTTLLAVMLWMPVSEAVAAGAPGDGKPRSVAARARAHVANVMHDTMMVLAKKAPAARTDGLSALVEDHMDLRTIGRYALGPAWKKASAGQREEFLAAFQGHVVALIAASSGSLAPALEKGVPLDDLFSVGRVRPSMHGMTVDSRLRTGDSQSVRIGWRLVKAKNAPFKIIDLTLDGVSLALDQRTALAALLTEAKMAHLKNRAQAAIESLSGRAGNGPATLASRPNRKTAGEHSN